MLDPDRNPREAGRSVEERAGALRRRDPLEPSAVTAREDDDDARAGEPIEIDAAELVRATQRRRFGGAVGRPTHTDGVFFATRVDRRGPAERVRVIVALDYREHAGACVVGHGARHERADEPRHDRRA